MKWGALHAWRRRAPGEVWIAGGVRTINGAPLATSGRAKLTKMLPGSHDRSLMQGTGVKERSGQEYAG